MENQKNERVGALLTSLFGFVFFGIFLITMFWEGAPQWLKWAALPIGLCYLGLQIRQIVALSKKKKG